MDALQTLRFAAVEPKTVTARELEALRWAAAGKTNIETAMILGVSTSAANQLIQSTMHKLNCANKTHAVAVALRTGLLQ